MRKRRLRRHPLPYGRGSDIGGSDIRSLTMPPVERKLKGPLDAVLFFCALHESGNPHVIPQ
ncbi:MAG: hypothetical protein L0Y72_13740 [Gemmataceae bacterium]|nr:hypothetical protein [Gemmataceae bacterium]MCI0740103.1 hypothetical protein [Gemmataceae bacterium]